MASISSESNRRPAIR